MKPVIIEDNNFLSSSSKNFIDTILLSNDFPFYYYPQSTEGDDNGNLCHIVLKRPEHRNNTENGINSHVYNECVSILNEFTKKHKITYKTLFRIAVNFSFNTGNKISPIHKDHDFKHNQLLIYLRCKDKKASTFIYNESKKNIIKEVYPEEYKGLYFNSLPHCLQFPKQGERIILVYTFK